MLCGTDSSRPPSKGSELLWSPVCRWRLPAATRHPSIRWCRRRLEALGVTEVLLPPFQAGLHFIDADAVVLELGVPVIAQESDGVGPALAAMTHELDRSHALAPQFLHLMLLRFPLAVQAEDGAVRRIGNQRHYVVHEHASRGDGAVDVHQM